MLEQQRVCAESAADANAELQTVEAEYETVMAQVSTMTTKEMELANALEELDASIRARKHKASGFAVPLIPYVFSIWYEPKVCARSTGAAASVARRQRERVARAGQASYPE